MFQRLELFPLTHPSGAVVPPLALGAGSTGAMDRDSPAVPPMTTAADFELWVDGAQRPRLLPVGGADPDTSLSADPAAIPAARLRVVSPCSYALPPTAFLTPLSKDLYVNGARPFGLKLVKPGDMIALRRTHLLLVRRFRASPQVAPPELADKFCPVCGLLLSAASICMCACGVWSHLQNPAGDPSSETELNCFLASPSCSCGRDKHLEEELIPNPPTLGWSFPTSISKEII